MATLEFREGKREVPDHLAMMMSGIETFKMTYEEAIAAANRNAEKRVIEKAYDQVLKDHFRPLR